MKTGQTVEQLLDEVIDCEKNKRDFLVQSSKVIFDAEHNTVEFGTDGAFQMKDMFHEQMAGRLDIPRAYYNRMREESPNLLEKNVQHWLVKSDERRMVRTLASSARAFLSDRYRPLDNYELLQTVLPVLTDKQMIIESCQVTERRLYLKMVSPKVTHEVRKGDVVRAGLVISNSEVGSGTLSVEPLIFRLVCMNGMIAPDSGMRKYHTGRTGLDFEGAVEFYRDETRIADDKAFWLKVRDTVAGAMDAINFKSIVDAMEVTTQRRQIADTPSVIEVTRKHFGLSDSEAGGVGFRYAEGRDQTLYGLINALTRYSQDVDNYERATEFERMGGKLLRAPNVEIKKLGF